MDFIVARFLKLKIGVLGEGSFFKAHKDTPRGETMFGSLVVVFPAHHKGGSLVLRRGGEEWTISSDELLEKQSKPSIAYVAFFSDVEHEVMPVEAGYRVTLTYNLYFGTADGQNGLNNACLVSPLEQGLRQTLEELLPNPNFLYKGGFMGFALRHQYPYDVNARSFAPLLNCLKGSDAIVKKVCETLSLKCTLQMIYVTDDHERYERMVDHPIELLTYGQQDDGPLEALESEGGRGISTRLGPDYPRSVNENAIWWITAGNEQASRNKVETGYIAYGNEARVGYVYGNLVLIVQVGPVNQRSVL
jgi:2OG-Fe(II) oxygenase superfamily